MHSEVEHSQARVKDNLSFFDASIFGPLRCSRRLTSPDTVGKLSIVLVDVDDVMVVIDEVDEVTVEVELVLVVNVDVDDVRVVNEPAALGIRTILVSPTVKAALTIVSGSVLRSKPASK